MQPARRPLAALAIAISPAHSGANALAPPMTMPWPSTRTGQPVMGSASPATSGHHPARPGPRSQEAPGDARTVTVLAIRAKNLRPVEADGDMVALRLMSERRRELGLRPPMPRCELSLGTEGRQCSQGGFSRAP